MSSWRLHCATCSWSLHDAMMPWYDDEMMRWVGGGARTRYEIWTCTWWYAHVYTNIDYTHMDILHTLCIILCVWYTQCIHTYILHNMYKRCKYTGLKHLLSSKHDLELRYESAPCVSMVFRSCVSSFYCADTCFDFDKRCVSIVFRGYVAFRWCFRSYV